MPVAWGHKKADTAPAAHHGRGHDHGHADDGFRHDDDGGGGHLPLPARQPISLPPADVVPVPGKAGSPRRQPRPLLAARPTLPGNLRTR